MNRYLLLRDNKQSGPYTAPELIAKGIKAYDLVWLDGKSAAWRYPSELDELKDFAPATEEQPYDRFYRRPAERKQPQEEKKHPDEKTGTSVKLPTADTAPAKKMEAVPKAGNDQDRLRFQPKVASAFPSRSASVYVNFPGAQNSLPATPASSSSAHAANTHASAKSDPPSAALRTDHSSYPDVAVTGNHSFSVSQESARTDAGQSGVSYPDRPLAPAYNHLAAGVRNRRLFYPFLAACAVIVALAIYMLIAYTHQRNNIRELNMMVKEMESARNSQAAGLLVSNTQPSANENVSVPPPVPPNEGERAGNDEETAMMPETSTRNTAKNAARRTADQRKATDETDIPVQSGSESTPPSSRPASPAPIDKEKEGTSANLFDLVTVQPNAYKTGVLGGISDLRLELTNNSDRSLHRVAVEIKYLGPEKKVVRSQTVYFENVLPGRQATLDVPKSSRGVTIDYRVTDIKS